MKATHQKIELMVGMTKLILEPGQFVYGRHVASDETGLKPSTIRNCMEWLKNNESLDIKSDNKKSVVTVINWGLYQSGEDEVDSKKDNNLKTTGQQQDTNKNNKNKKNIKNNISIDYFSDFWTDYPKKVDKPRAERAFAKLKMNDDLMNKLMAGLYKYIDKKWKGKEKEFIPNPATWLNGRRWEDEIT